MIYLFLCAFGSPVGCFDFGEGKGTSSRTFEHLSNTSTTRFNTDFITASPTVQWTSFEASKPQGALNDLVQKQLSHQTYPVLYGRASQILAQGLHLDLAGRVSSNNSLFFLCSQFGLLQEAVGPTAWIFCTCLDQMFVRDEAPLESRSWIPWSFQAIPRLAPEEVI